MKNVLKVVLGLLNTNREDAEQKPLSMISSFISGFTLMELLVVILIIGMLSSVAVPKYTQLLWKAKASNLLTITNSIGKSHQRYYDDNYECAPSLDSLDLGIDGALPLGPSVSRIHMIDDYVTVLDGKGNDDFEVLLVSQARQGCWTIGRFKKGPWERSGFGVIHTNNTGISKEHWGKTICIAEQYYTKSDFCEKFLSKSDDLFHTYGYNYLYNM